MLGTTGARILWQMRFRGGSVTSCPQAMVLHMCYMSTISHRVTISHREMRNNSAEVLRRVEAGETITVTNHGRAVARLSPVRKAVLEELIEKGQVRPASTSAQSLRDIPRVKLPKGVATADIIADVRGYDRGC